MKYVIREQEKQIRRALERNKSVLLLGPRQTGKTTLIQRLVADLSISLITPEIRLRYEKEPGILRKEIEALEPKGEKRPVVVLISEMDRSATRRCINVVFPVCLGPKRSTLLFRSRARRIRLFFFSIAVFISLKIFVKLV